jgi:Primosomal protein N'' (replication factor Y) - superfamily II helicase
MSNLAKCPNCRFTFSPNMSSCPYCARVFIHCSHCGSTNYEKLNEDKKYKCLDCQKEFEY